MQTHLPASFLKSSLSSLKLSHDCSGKLSKQFLHITQTLYYLIKVNYKLFTHLSSKIVLNVKNRSIIYGTFSPLRKSHF